MKRYRLQQRGLVLLIALAAMRSVVQAGATPDARGLLAGDRDSSVSGAQLLLEADLAITKLDGPDPVGAGAALVYTINVSNAGPAEAVGVIVSDPLPGGVSFGEATGDAWVCVFALGTVTCTLDLLAVGDAHPIVITVHAPNGAATLSNTATVASVTSDPSSGNNQATAITTVTGPADLAIAQVDAPDPVDAGAPLTYTLSMTNLGPDPAFGVTVTDTLPSTVAFQSAVGTGWTCSRAAATVTCNRATLAVGPAPTITIAVTAPAAGGSIANTATIASTATDPVSANNSATASTSVTAVADISITNTDSPDPVSSGANLTYTLTAANAGPSRATGITVRDTLPAGVAYQSFSGSGWTCGQASGVVTCMRSNINAGTSRTLTLVVKAPGGNATLTNTVSITAATVDHDPSDNTAVQQTTVTDGTAPADLSIATTEAPDPVDASGALTYSLAVANAGPGSASSVTVTDTLPAGVTFVSASGSGWSCSRSGSVVTCTRGSLAAGAAPAIAIAVTAPNAGATIQNSATVASTTPDPNTANNADDESTTVRPPIPTADLTIAIADSPDPANSGATLTYTLAVVNRGPNSASSVSVTNTLPSGVLVGSVSGTGWACNRSGAVVTCTRGSLAVGNAPAITITVTTPSSGRTIIDSATVSSATLDPASGNNSDTESTTVATVPQFADLSLTQSDLPDPVNAAAALAYTLNVANAGPNPASDVVVTDTLPPGAVFGSAVGSGWTCGQASGVVTCTRTPLAVGTASPIVVTLVAPADGGPVVNEARVASATNDPAPANNAESETTSVVGISDLAVAETDQPDPVPTGQRFTAALGVVNAGPSRASSIRVTDTLPAGTTFFSAAGSGWSCAHADGTVTCTRPELPPGEGPPISLTVVAPSTGGTIINHASVSGAEIDVDTSDNNAARSIRVLPLSEVHDIAVTKIKAPSTVKLTASTPSRKVRVTVQIQNRGGHQELILDRGILSRLVTLSVQSLGPCRAPTPVLGGYRLGKHDKLNVDFEVSFDCANDPLAAGGDYLYVASIHREVVDGQADVHPSDDVCPRSVPPPYVLDPYPNATIRDRGCGKPKPDGTKGAPVMTDVVVR